MSGGQIHLTDPSRIQRFATTLIDVAYAHPFHDDAVVDLYAAALDAFEEALAACERKLAELHDQLEQSEDDDARADLRQQINELEQKKAQIRVDKQQATQAKRSYEDRAKELDRSFAADVERVGTALTRFVQGLERASNA